MEFHLINEIFAALAVPANETLVCGSGSGKNFYGQLSVKRHRPSGDYIKRKGNYMPHRAEIEIR